MVQPLLPAARAVAELQHSVWLPWFFKQVINHRQPVLNRMVLSLAGSPHNKITKHVKNVTDKSHVKNVANELNPGCNCG